MLTKAPIAVNFARGLDTKTDPKQVPIGNFRQLQNTVFNKGGLLQKRNGFATLAALPDTDSSYLTTFAGNLTAVGSSIRAYSTPNAAWVSRGMIYPMAVSTLPLIKNNLNQTQVDSVVSPNGLVCSVYTETNGTTIFHRYVVADAVTGQNIVAPAIIPVASGAVTGGMRVFYLGRNFILVFTNVIAGVSHLQYVTVNSANPALVGPNTDLASLYVPASTLSWDGVVVGPNLYIAYNTTAGGQSVKVVYLTQGLIVVGPTTFAGQIATAMSVTADVSTPASPVIWVSYYDSASTNGHTLAVSPSLATLLAPVATITGVPALNIVSAAQNGVAQIFYEVDNNYAWDAGIPTHYVSTMTITLPGVVGTPYYSIRSVGLASKAFVLGGTIYYLAAFQSPYQPTYFLVDGTESTSAAPRIAAKLAYSNGGGYLTTGLPSVTVTGTLAQVPYLFKDLITAVNKNTAVPAGNQVAGIYSQTGITLGSLDIRNANVDAAEIGSDLHLSGGFLWGYDGFLPVEHNFFLWPDTDIATPANSATWSAVGGSMAAKPDGATNTSAYYYVYLYEWTDNQGNAFRSAPSIPIPVTTTGGLTTGSVTLNVPTLRVTMKTVNPVKITIYRWSVAQQSYYQVTSIGSPLLNNPTIDTVTFVDTSADATILGNALLYTTGGVVEDVNAPASSLMTLFDSRLWLVDAEDQNLLWFSKQVIEATPVEMSDLFTVYVPPALGTNEPSGPISAVSVMDDKLIIFKKNAINYINGTGPDNTGANNGYSPAIFVTSTVGCDNQKSIVLTPAGLMFQSNKGIWLLDRGLNTSYIGAPVEDFNSGIVTSAVNVPGTNQVRFTLDSGAILMYDYFYQQWGSFDIGAVSSCIFSGLHSYINKYGAAYQESPGKYLDGSRPVLMKFRTGPLRLGDLQNYQRAYFFYILGEYLSPHKLQVSMAFDYAEAPSQAVLIAPTNFSPAYGAGLSQSPYGAGSPYGGSPNLEQWRVFLKQQRCQAFDITLEEVFDPSFGVPAGAGLTISGLNIICGFKKAFRPQAARTSIG